MPPPKGTWNPLEAEGDHTTTSVVHNDTYDAIDPRKANLTGKTVYVNGGSRGIGKEIAMSFAKAGASQIVVSARSDLTQVAKDIKNAATDCGRNEPEVLTLKVEVDVPESVELAAKEISKTCGTIDILINVAAVMGDLKNIGDSDPDDWWNTSTLPPIPPSLIASETTNTLPVTTNVRGPYLVSRACLPLLLASNTKTLVNISSVGALVTGPSLSAYQISKTAVNRLTDFINAEYSNQGFTAFCVHPGNVLTDMAPAGLDDKWKAIFTETPALCADTLVFLTALEDRVWLGGRYVNCTWDMPELFAMKERIVEGDLLKSRLRVP